MGNFLKKQLLIMCLSACAILLFSGCSKSNETIATFKGGTLTVQDFYDNPKVKSNNQTLLKKMIVFKAFDDVYGKEISSKEVTKEYNEQIKKLGPNYKEQLKAVGQTEETYKKLFKQMLAFQYGLKANVKLTDKDLDTAWKEFYPEVSTQIILFSTKEEADKAKKEANEGENFSKLVQAYGKNKTLKETDGKMNFDSTNPEIPTEVKKAAFKLKNGEVSDIIPVTDPTTYQQSYYLVKMVKKQDKGSNKDKYKSELEKIATEAKTLDTEFMDKTNRKVIKKDNVTIKDPYVKNIFK
ncbi:peptidyl-prolyl cis-trans isomerase [Enterococcus faecium]|nr:peptidyl-prolyl cis-trans isomerase [Enterococcus faecium]